MYPLSTHTKFACLSVKKSYILIIYAFLNYSRDVSPLRAPLRPCLGRCWPCNGGDHSQQLPHFVGKGLRRWLVRRRCLHGFRRQLGRRLSIHDRWKVQRAFSVSPCLHYRPLTLTNCNGPSFIDAEDTPPTSCSVDFSRDCTTKGCSISAITNYTSRVQDTSLSPTERMEAMEFLIHFLGDITQPLHDEAEEVGGNDIAVTWDGTKTNLHACWDTQMVEKIAGGENSTATVDSFAAQLITQIDNGTYASQKEDWVSCVDITTAQDCATEWAQDANALNCQYVLQNDESGMELDGTYYTGAVPYIELQISKGGYRLGAWLNALAAAA